METIETVLEFKKGLLTPQEAAGLLGVKPLTLEKWRRTGRYNLPFVKVGRRCLYSAADIKAFLQTSSNPRRGAPLGRHRGARRVS